MNHRRLDQFAWAGMAIVSLVCVIASGHLAMVQAAAQNRDPGFRVNRSTVADRLGKAALAEMDGQQQQAELELLGAAAADRRFAPAWALAQFYHRQNRTQEYRVWLIRAAEMSYGDRTALFERMAQEFGRSSRVEIPTRIRAEYEAYLRATAR